MKRLKKTALLFSTLLFVSLFSACDMYSYITPSTSTSYDNPSWAPPYYQGVRYYYIPDIECYYDLSTQEFVYLDNGEWSYSQNLPSIYDGFDLGNCFTVALDYSVYQPWMHHHYYVSHYPRYYYRDYYDHSNIANVRGFNENNKSAILWSENERNRARNWDSENLKTDHQFIYSKPDRQQQNININNNSTNRTPDTNNNTRTQPDNNPNRGTYNGNNQSPSRGNNNPATPVSPANGNINHPDGNNKTSIVAPPRISGFETPARQQNAITPVKPAQNTNYYGRTIGQPVKVEKQMRQRTPVNNAPANTNPRNNE
jgi:hypothetical protein